MIVRKSVNSSKDEMLESSRLSVYILDVLRVNKIPVREMDNAFAFLHNFKQISCQPLPIKKRILKNTNYGYEDKLNLLQDLMDSSHQLNSQKIVSSKVSILNNCSFIRYLIITQWKVTVHNKLLTPVNVLTICWF